MDLQCLRHSTAHVMAAAVCRLYDDVKLDIGPATDDGFYYDFDVPKRFTPEDFEAIETEMAKIVAEKLPFECVEVSRDEAEKLFTDSNQSFKIERLNDIPDGDAITLYKCGEFVDLCRGPHVESTGDIRAFKLTSVAGSYFRGVETNPMLQRLYGIVASDRKALRIHLAQIAEAKKRDHRKIGRELDLFSVQEDVGPGLIHWHPKGARIRSIIEDYWRREHFRAGYELLYTPHIGKGNLWETSGHLECYSENMYAPMEVDKSPFYVRPMNCPFHIEVYKSHKRSYRELPLRWAELGTVYRYEKSGVLHGLLRVRGFTQDDAHIFCTPAQIEDEVELTLKFAIKILKTFGFDDITAYLATKPEKAVGDDARWEQATASIQNALDSSGVSYEVDPGGGAFYGPKIDVKIKDALGRQWQLSTIQFDFNLPERFNLSYIGEDGKEHQPYMVHRALLGSLERFFGILIEHYAGAFPVWLAPEQVRVLPLTENQIEYSKEVLKTLLENDIRASIDEKSEKVGAKIRRARGEMIPYMLILGSKEEEAGAVAVRERLAGDIGAVSITEFIERIRKENEPDNS